MKKNYLLLLSVFTVLSMVFISCSSDDDDDKLSVKNTTLNFDSETLKKNIEVIANVQWEASCNDDWCIISKTSGNGNDEIEVTLLQNPSAVEGRIATITLTAEGLPKVKVTINQQAANTLNAEVKEIIIPTTLWNKWKYFSFATGQIVEEGGADLTTDAVWKAREDWDLAFIRLYSRTNSGESGNGKGGVIEIGADQTNKESVFNNLAIAPTSDYVTDEICTTDTGYGKGLLIAMPPATYEGSYSPTLSSWLSSSMPIVVTEKVFAVKTADGKYAKVHMISYVNDAGSSGYVRMKYLYQADGSTNLANKD